MVNGAPRMAKTPVTAQRVEDRLRVSRSGVPQGILQLQPSAVGLSTSEPCANVVTRKSPLLLPDVQLLFHQLQTRNYVHIYPDTMT
jgi:hypothetical protein